MELHDAGVTFVQHSGCVSAQWPCKVLLLDFKRLLSSPEEYKKLQAYTNVWYLRDQHFLTDTWRFYTAVFRIGSVSRNSCGMQRVFTGHGSSRRLQQPRSTRLHYRSRSDDAAG